MRRTDRHRKQPSARRQSGHIGYDARGQGPAPEPDDRVETWSERRSDRLRDRRRTSGAGRSSPAGLAWLVVFVIVVAVIGGVAFTTFRGRDGDGGTSSGTGGTAGTPTPTARAAGGVVSATPSPTPSPTATALSVVAGGDVMGDRRVDSYIRAHGSASVLSGIADVLRPADLAFVNLESPLSTLGRAQTWKDVTFAGNPALASALGKAGVDVVTMANNHAVDYGAEALLDTIARLNKAGVEVVGAGRDKASAWRAALIERGGLKVGCLGFSDILPQGYTAGSGPGIAAARVDASQVAAAITATKRKADIVVVAFHWGIEITRTPIAAQVAEAHAAIDAGASLVIGSHPHVLQGFEAYHGGLIAYSLGDLVFDHSSVETGETVLLQATVGAAGGIRAELIPVYLSSDGVPAVVSGAEAATILTRVQELSGALHTVVKVKGDRGLIRVAAASRD